MIKIYDCSNSSNRPLHRGTSRIIENTVVTALKQNADRFGCKFVESAEDAEVIFTNDVFDTLYPNHYKVKRMDGVFLTPETIGRNGLLNNAAYEADHVIFISDYSFKTFEYNYLRESKALRSASVIENWVDSSLFFPQDGNSPNRRLRFASCCTDWCRPEKRLSEIIKLATMDPYSDFYIFGECVDDVPPNVIKVGFLPNFLWAQSIKVFDGFINMSYRDPCPKVVIEAIASGVPVLAAHSGGTVDLGKYGHVEFVLDKDDIRAGTPDLSLKEGALEQAFYTFKKNNWTKCIESYEWAKENNKRMFENMLKKYFKILTDL